MVHQKQKLCVFKCLMPGAFSFQPFSSILKLEIVISQNSSPLTKPVLSYPFLKKTILYCNFQNMTNVPVRAQDSLKQGVLFGGGADILHSLN